MTNKKQDEGIPYFIRMRGCINCDASKHHKEQTGFDYGFDHESMFSCVILCAEYGFSLLKPFFDPEEAVRLAKKDGSPELIEGARKYCLRIKKEFGEHYERMGISIDDIVKSLD